MVRGMPPSVLPKYSTLTCIYRAKYQQGLEGFRHSSLWMLPEIEISSELSTMETITILPLAFIAYNNIHVIHGHPLPRLTSHFCENHLIVVFGQNLSCWSS